MTSNPEQYYITYDFKTKGISLLSQEQQNFYLSSLKNQLNISINDYNSKKLYEQDTILFDFNEELFNNTENKNILVPTIQKLIETIEQSDNYNFVKNQKITLKDTNQGIYNVNYKEICAIVNYIIGILKSIPKKHKEKIYKILYFEGEIPEVKLEINGIKLQKVKINTDSIKQMNICISEKNYNILEMKTRNEINLNVIKLFILFFRAFFKNVLTLNIDLNIYEINNYFNKESNPYKIKENRVLKLSKFYENVFLSNLIIIKNISKFSNLSNIKYILYDSYQIEFYQLMFKYFSKNSETQNTISNNNTKEEEVIPAFRNKILYLDHLIQKQIKNYFDFYLEINALDPLLFLKVNLLLLQYKSVINITINFFNLENVNLRKTLINAYYFFLYLGEKEKDKINPNQPKFYPDKINTIFENDYMIYYNYINNIKEYKNKLLLRDEEIPNELFPYFNYNLNLLFFILMDKFKSDKNIQNSLSFNFQSVNDSIINLHSYNSYNCAILSFIFNLFHEIEVNPNLEKLCLLEIYLDDLTDKKEYIIQYIFENFRNNLPFNFKKINLTIFKLDIPNITLILPFENFPCNILNQLTLRNLSFNDLENIATTLVKNKPIFKKLSTLEISIGFMLEDFKKYIRILLTESISKKLINFNLTIPCYLSYMDIVDMLTWIKKAEDKNVAYFLKLANEDLSMYRGNISFLSEVEIMKKKIKKELHKRNLIVNFDDGDNYKEINIKIKRLNKEEINYFLNFIFCFNKKYEKTNNNAIKEEKRQKIFENIFYYMGKFGKKNKEINIEII